jgi:hypothetical protein
MSVREEQEATVMVMKLLQDFDGLEVNKLRAGDYMVVTYLINILEIWVTSKMRYGRENS